MDSPVLRHDVGLLEPLVASWKVTDKREFVVVQIKVIFEILFLRKILITQSAAELRQLLM